MLIEAVRFVEPTGGGELYETDWRGASQVSGGGASGGLEIPALTSRWACFWSPAKACGEACP